MVKSENNENNSTASLSRSSSISSYEYSSDNDSKVVATVAATQRPSLGDGMSEFEQDMKMAIIESTLEADQEKAQKKQAALENKVASKIGNWVRRVMEDKALSKDAELDLTR